MLRDQVAAHYLADVACEVLFRYPGPMPWNDLWRRVTALAPVDGDTLEAVLAEDVRFVPLAGRWDLAPRLEAQERPLGGALEGLLECYGKPMPRVVLIAELCLGRPGSPPQTDQLLARLLASSRDLAAFDDCLYCTSWLPRLGANDPQGLLFINQLTDDEAFRSLHRKLLAAQHRQRQILDTAEAVLKAARVPLHNRALGLVLHAHHAERFAPATTLADMASDDRFVCLSGPAWALSTQEKAWRKALAPREAPAPTPERPLDFVQILQAPASERVRLGEEDMEALQQFAEALRTPIGVLEAVQGALGLRPRQRHFPGAVHAVEGAFAADLSLTRLRPGTYLRRRAVPPWANEVPEALRPVHGPLTLGETDEALVPIAELPAQLADEVLDPAYEDIGETELTVVEEPLTEISLTIPWHHWRCGTLMLRQRDRSFFRLPASLTLLTLHTPDDRRLPVWANSQTSLLYGLLTWYDEVLPPSGAIVTLSRTDEPDVLVLEYNEETDHAARIGADRMAQLLALRDRLQRRPTTLAETVATVLQGHAKGLAFDPLWFQLNIVRRTTRHQLASALMLAEALQQAEGGRWRAL
ncbi:hypothetical protein LLH23_20630 [bacterium]|nr:hypothetical protein [bacterium]